MNQIVDQALKVWGLDGATYVLAAERENQVFRVEYKKKSIAVRLHRPGYRSDAELRSELEWMAALSAGGVTIPSPVPTMTGAFLVTIDGTQVDALDWLAGSTLSECLDDLSVPERRETFFNLGKQMAQLHNQSDAWQVPQDFGRVSWDIDGLLGDVPLWDRFWENSGLSDAERALFIAFRKRAQNDLTARLDHLDFGLIHADLVPSNVLYDRGTLNFIDFDDGGWGFRLFDVATALLKHQGAADFADLQGSLLAGYRSERPLDVSAMDLMLCVRALTYVGWNIKRINETGGRERNTRFIQTAAELCSEYMGSQSC